MAKQTQEEKDALSSLISANVFPQEFFDKWDTKYEKFKVSHDVPDWDQETDNVYNDAMLQKKEWKKEGYAVKTKQTTSQFTGTYMVQVAGIKKKEKHEHSQEVIFSAGTLWSKDVKLKVGGLAKYGYKMNAPESVRHRALGEIVKDESYKTAVGRLQFLINIADAKDNKKLVKIATADRNWLQKKYRDKQDRYATGAIIKNVKDPNIYIPMAIIIGTIILLTAFKMHQLDVDRAILN